MSVGRFYRDIPGAYSALLQRRTRGESISVQDLQKACSDVLSNGLDRPFVYSVVRNADGVLVGHLIGTSHCCNQAMLNNGKILDIVRTCGRFFMEWLPKWCVDISPSDFVGGACIIDSSPEILPRLGMKFMMDCSLCMVARSEGIGYEVFETDDEHKIRIESVEEEVSRVRVTADGFEYASRKNRNGEYQQALAQGTVSWESSLTDEEKEVEMVEYYQRGSAQQMYSYMLNLGTSILQKIIFQPNVTWTTRSIIPALTKFKSGDRPICVAVGVNHLLGQPSDSQQTSISRFCESEDLSLRGHIPKEPEKSVFRLERKLPRIDDRRLRKLVRINAIRTNLRSSIIGALAKPKSRFFRFFGYKRNNTYQNNLHNCS